MSMLLVLPGVTFKKISVNVCLQVVFIYKNIGVSEISEYINIMVTKSYFHPLTCRTDVVPPLVPVSGLSLSLSLWCSSCGLFLSHYSVHHYVVFPYQ